MSRWISIAVMALLAGCGSAKNTPEEALEALRTALAEERWDLLHDVLPVEVQNEYQAKIADLDRQIEAIAQQFGPAQADVVVREQLGMSRAEWATRDSKQRFEALFESGGKLQLRELGVNPDHVGASEIKSVDVRGDKATILLDDGKGHRTRLHFVLDGDTWRFDLGGNG